jgi:glycosyltransferase involved in cell wall biosynthesis
MTRILLTFDWFLEYSAEQALALRSADAEVFVVCRDHLEEFAGDHTAWLGHLADMRASGIEVAIVEGRTASIRAMQTAARARRLVRNWSPDIVHAHPNADPWLLLGTRGLPVVLTVHDPQPHPGQPELPIAKRQVEAAWMRRADGFVVHGAQLRDTLSTRVGSVPIAVIPHGVRLSAEPAPIPVERDILLLGRLEPYKGIDVLIMAMEEVWRTRPDVTLTVAGRGVCADDVPVHPKIQRIVRYVSEAEVSLLLDKATLFVAPYTEASQSGAVSLALGRGVPAVVSDAGALPDLAVDASFVVPAGDAGALARALLAKLDHGAGLRRRVHAMARERLSWSVAGALTLAFYDEILNS